MDITECRIAEEAIRRTEAYLAETQGLSHTGGWGWKLDAGEIVWSDETYSIFGYDRAEEPTRASVFARIHLDDKALAQKTIDGASPNTNR